MSSTDESRLRRFFQKRLIPVADKLRARSFRFFPLAPEPDMDTWYEGPPSEPKFTSLDVDECEAALRDTWANQDLPELVELAGELMDLARQLEIHEEESADVSPFVYVMY